MVRVWLLNVPVKVHTAKMKIAFPVMKAQIVLRVNVY
jgi:hypothetical protein